MDRGKSERKRNLFPSSDSDNSLGLASLSSSSCDWYCSPLRSESCISENCENVADIINSFPLNSPRNVGFDNLMSTPTHLKRLPLDDLIERVARLDKNLSSNYEDLASNLEDTVGEHDKKTDVMEETILQLTPKNDSNLILLTPFKSLLKKRKPSTAYSKNVKWAESVTPKTDYLEKEVDSGQKNIIIPVSSFYNTSSRAKTSLFPEVKIRANSSESKSETKQGTLRRKSSPHPLINRHAKRGIIKAGVKHNIRRPKLNHKKGFHESNKHISFSTALQEPSEQIVMYNETLTKSEGKKHIENVLSSPVSAGISSKRKLYSPPSPTVDSSKRFFVNPPPSKDKRRITVSINNVKFEMKDGKLSLKRKPIAMKRNVKQMKMETKPKVLDVDFIESDDDGVEADNDKIKGILKDLNKMCESENNSIAVLENKAAFSNTNDNNSQPTTPVQLNSDKENAHMVTTNESLTKRTPRPYFPIFYKDDTPKSSVSSPHVNRNAITKLKFSAVDSNQYLIDAGQKRFGVTLCNDCGFMFSVGEAEDEQIHIDYHNNISVLRFWGWKREIVVGNYPDGRVILVTPSDPKAWKDKVISVLEVVDKELGYAEKGVENLHVSKTYLFVETKENRIAGCLVAEPLKKAYRMLLSEGDLDCCSVESYPVYCGINRIWVAEWKRRCGIATRLANCVRSNFIPGKFLEVDDIAFSTPTVTGKSFAEKYTNKQNYLVYT